MKLVLMIIWGMAFGGGGNYSGGPVAMVQTSTTVNEEVCIKAQKLINSREPTAVDQGKSLVVKIGCIPLV